MALYGKPQWCGKCKFYVQYNSLWLCPTLHNVLHTPPFTYMATPYIHPTNLCCVLKGFSSYCQIKQFLMSHCVSVRMSLYVMIAYQAYGWAFFMGNKSNMYIAANTA